MYANEVTEEEIERAKRKVYIEILQHETQGDLSQSIANNVMYYDRKVSNKEVAERVSVVGAKEIQMMCQKMVNNATKVPLG